MATKRFHEGERAVQERYGTRDGVAGHETKIFESKLLNGSIARFVGSLPLVATATRDPDGWPFPSVEPGPLRILGPEAVALPSVRDHAQLAEHLRGHPKIGMLAIDLARRFRFRINGRATIDQDGLAVQIEHAFGNCQQYLHRIDQGALTTPAIPEVAPWRSRLEPPDVQALAEATHVFIATQDADGDLDAQYKGGLPGWLTVDQDGDIAFPDYYGNGYFMSLGNLQQDPRLGMLVPGGALLFGHASLDDRPEVVGHFPGAERVIRVRPDRIASARGLMPFEETFVAASPMFAEPASTRDDGCRIA